jgi:hypothetical protein
VDVRLPAAASSDFAWQCYSSLPLSGIRYGFASGGEQVALWTILAMACRLDFFLWLEAKIPLAITNGSSSPQFVALHLNRA